MKQVTKTYNTYAEIKAIADQRQQKVLETSVAFYFRIFEFKNFTELHIFYKPK